MQFFQKSEETQDDTQSQENAEEIKNGSEI